MAMIIFCEIQGIPGECNVSYASEYMEGPIEVRQFSHGVFRMVDPLDSSKIVSDRRHNQACIVTHIDKSLPLLFRALIIRAPIEWIQLAWWRQPPDGSSEPEQYFVQTFSHCLITAVCPRIPDATLGTNRGPEVGFCFSFRQVTWNSATGGQEFTDEIRR